MMTILHTKIYKGYPHKRIKPKNVVRSNFFVIFGKLVLKYIAIYVGVMFLGFIYYQ